MRDLPRIECTNFRNIDFRRSRQRLHHERCDSAANIEAADYAVDMREMMEAAAVGADAPDLRGRRCRPTEPDRVTKPSHLLRRAVVLRRHKPRSSAADRHDMDLLFAQPIGDAARAQKR